MEPRRHRAGERINDLCRACHIERDHTVIVVDADGRALRVTCGFCGSQHNYRGEASPRPAREATRLVTTRRACGWLRHRLPWSTNAKGRHRA